MKIKQLDLFIESNTYCTCPRIMHDLTKIDYQYSLNKLKRIKDIIKDTGWDLSGVYYHYHDKVNNECSAWDTSNLKYLSMRSQFHEEFQEIQLNVRRTKVY